MSMNAAELGLRRTGNPKDAAYADVIAGILKARGADIPLPTDVQSLPQPSQPDLTWNGALQTAKEHWINHPHTPENVTNILETIWKVREYALRKAGIDMDLTPTPCTYTQEEVRKLEAEGRRVGYLPPELATQEQRHLLGILFPEMESHSVQLGNMVTNEADRSGWFDYEVPTNAPHLDTTEASLRNSMQEEDRLGMSLNEYIIASQDNKVLTGKYLDEGGTWTCLLGSRDGGRVVRARFNAIGGLAVGSRLRPRDHGGNLGGRFVGVPASPAGGPKQ